METKKKIVEIERKMDVLQSLIDCDRKFDNGLLHLIKSVVGDVAKIQKRLAKLESKL